MKTFSRFEPSNFKSLKSFSKYVIFQALGVNILLRKAALISTPTMEVLITFKSKQIKQHITFFKAVKLVEIHLK